MAGKFPFNYQPIPLTQIQLLKVANPAYDFVERRIQMKRQFGKRGLTCNKKRVCKMRERNGCYCWTTYR
ncbi:hypothetical protein CEXT_59641 [Caerostris extrusa]|uniref:Uncharacterized protein n=1 Tax=Caerostris extrusa TaxID=172846 RepID=A0AAV4QVZ9_CAEEX|nr:hypothetical protein CEXT_59641 [Caerostris extrusa]